MINLIFVFDEYSDIEDEYGVRKLAVVVMDAFKNPYKPCSAGECIVGEIARQCWERALLALNFTPSAEQRFIETFSLYMEGCARQAKDRGRCHIRSINDYFPVRRNTMAVRPFFGLLETDLDLPDEAMKHPAVIELSVAAMDMIVLCNDVHSYNVEQARGDGDHNIITVVMHELGTDIQGAMEWAGERHRKLASSFMLAKSMIPSWGNVIDKDMAVYIDGVGNWVRANDHWSLQSQRYYGKSGFMDEGRWVRLLPKIQGSYE